MKKSRTNYLQHAIITTIICTLSINLSGQSVGVSSGFGYSTFFDFKENKTHSFGNYEMGAYQFLRLDLNSYIPEASFLSLHFKLERSKSSIESMDRNIRICGNSVFTSVIPDIYSEFTLYRMSVGVMPINFKIYKNVRFKAGTELSRVFKTSILERIDETNDFGEDFIVTPRNDAEFIKEYGVGFIFELQLGKFELCKDLSISPIYNSSISLTEDIKTGFYTRTLRQSLGLAIRWNMKPKFHIQ